MLKTILFIELLTASDSIHTRQLLRGLCLDNSFGGFLLTKPFCPMISLNYCKKYPACAQAMINDFSAEIDKHVEDKKLLKAKIEELEKIISDALSAKN